MARIPCTIFSLSNPTKICGRETHRFIPIMMGTLARLHERDDAMLCGYAPVCAHHAEMTPPTLNLLRHEDIGLIAPVEQ